MISGVTGAWAVIAAMFAWALTLSRLWAGVDRLPMQFGFDGRPTWFAARLPALLALPVLAAALLLFVTVARRGPSPAPLPTALLMLAVQALWVFLARRYV